MAKGKAFKVWVYPAHLQMNFQSGDPCLVFPRKEGVKRRVSATLVLSPSKPKKGKKVAR